MQGHFQFSILNYPLKSLNLSEIQSVKNRFGIIGTAPALNYAINVAMQVAATDLTVLITGESGSGKESFSKIIHSLSSRKHGNFIAINCGAIPEGTIDSELFGHEKGAFTGALDARKGYFETTNGGTIFLDEIGEMPIGTQSRLLRVLENGEYIRVGASKVQKTDVRVVAATNVNLREAVNTGKFREDLYYRLNVVHFTLPPLRARDGDVRILMTAFLEEFACTARRSPPEVTAEVWTILERHAWPGNVRELRNTAQRLVVLDNDGRITPEDLDDALQSRVKLREAEPASWPLSYSEAQDKALRDFRAAYVGRLLEVNGGNVSRAAVAAGVSRRTLHRWLAELNGAVAREES